MPRKFTEDEREQVRARILEAGKELFARYGAGKTTMDEVARAAGIGKGTVYLFFPSKEDLLFELIRREYGVRDALLERLEQEDALTAATFRAELEKTLHDLTDSSLLTALFRNEGQIVSRLLSEEKMAEHDRDEAQFIDALVAILQKKGFKPKSGPEVLLGLFHVIWLSRIYRGSMLCESYAQIEGMLLDLLCGELTGK